MSNFDNRSTLIFTRPCYHLFISKWWFSCIEYLIFVCLVFFRDDYCHKNWIPSTVFRVQGVTSYMFQLIPWNVLFGLEHEPPCNRRLLWLTCRFCPGPDFRVPVFYLRSTLSSSKCHFSPPEVTQRSCCSEAFSYLNCVIKKKHL